MGKQTIVDRTSEGVGKILTIVILATAALTWLEVFLRYVVGAPTVWAPELIQAFSATVFLFAGSVAMSRDAHIRIGFVYENLSGTGLRIVALVCLVCAIIFVGGLTYGAYKQFVDSVWRFSGDTWMPETTGRAWNVPLPPFTRLMMLLACILFLLQSCVTFGRTAFTRPEGRNA